MRRARCLRLQLRAMRTATPQLMRPQPDVALCWAPIVSSKCAPVLSASEHHTDQCCVLQEEPYPGKSRVVVPPILLTSPSVQVYTCPLFLHFILALQTSGVQRRITSMALQWQHATASDDAWRKLGPRRPASALCGSISEKRSAQTLPSFLHVCLTFSRFFNGSRSCLSAVPRLCSVRQRGRSQTCWSVRSFA